MKKFFLFLMTISVLSSLAGLSYAADVPAPKDQLYIEVSALGGIDYFVDHKMGMEKVGEELGVKTDYVGPPDYDMNAMIAAFEQAIARKPQGLVVVGFEDSLNAIIKKAMDSGIPVVTVDADLPESGRLAFVGTGNFAAGQAGAAKMAEIIGGKGKVALMTKPGQSNLEERIAGYEDTLSKYPDIEIVQIADTQSDPVVAAQAAAALLQKFPDLAGIACVEAAGGSGAATAVKEAGLQGKVKIICMDRGNDVIAAIEEGVITASVAQQTALMPYYATQILYNLVNSNVEITSDNKAAGVLGIPNVVDTGSIIVDANNAKYFKR
ncbi:MAG: substrate-binding domain-containing protein [Synergistaceae bacterium]|jgi:ribose transport system substrate-binding protein|nr:substrate-binding domain-containing protein [Synergistaceae bacterium]